MMKAIGVAIDDLVYKNTHDKDDPDFLRNHPGNAVEAFVSAGGRLRKHRRMAALSDEEFEIVLKRVWAEYQTAQALCESPIERAILAALMTANWHFLDNPFVPVVDAKKKGKLPDMPIVIIPQFNVMNYRLDLAIAAKGKDRGFVWAVECDGKDYHDAAADFERDVNLKALGIRTSRLSGSTIYRDPTAAADTIVDHLWFWLTQQ